MDQPTIDNIGLLRAENYTYAGIGKVLGMSGNTVKSICRRYGFVPAEGAPMKNINKAAQISGIKRCRNCNRIILNPWNRAVKAFCSDRCRYKWWNRERAIRPHTAMSRNVRDRQPTVGNEEEDDTDEK